MNPFSKWKHCNALTRQNAWSHLTLEPLPIYRDEEKHKYFWEPTNEWLNYSTTECCNNKTPEALANIERYRHGPNGWEIRGKTVHHCLETKMLGNEPADAGDFTEWVEPLLNDPFWENFEPWAVEYMLCDLEKSVGGQLDLLGYDHESDRLMLIDLKSQSKSGRTYSTNAQLGSYVDALKKHHGLEVDICKTVWAKPGKTTIGDDQPVDECLNAWHEAWDRFLEKQGVPF